MSATSNPFGFRPVKHKTGFDRPEAYTILSGYATNIFFNQSVILNTNGTVTAGTAAVSLLGTFAGCRYTDATGKINVSKFWPASTVATNITAFVYSDPNIVYEVQCDGSLAQTAVGDQADITNAATGSTSTGDSASTISATLAGAGVQAQWRIVGFGLAVDNAVGDAFTIARVQLARHQYTADRVAI